MRRYGLRKRGLMEPLESFLAAVFVLRFFSAREKPAIKAFVCSAAV